MENKNLFTNGARLVRRHLRIVVWIFVVNLILAWFASGPVRTTISPILDHSLSSRRMVHEFDLGAWIELIREPSVPLRSFAAGSLHFSMIFVLYMIFINGGVLTVYREDRKLTKAEFFEMSGAYLWRIVRLVLISCIPFAILGALFSSLSGWSDMLTSDATNAHTGFWVLLGGGILLWIAFLFVRAWFDLAQSMTVARNDRGMLRNAWNSLVLSLRNAGTLLDDLRWHSRARNRGDGCGLRCICLRSARAIQAVVRGAANCGAHRHRCAVVAKGSMHDLVGEARPAVAAPPMFERGPYVVAPIPTPVVPAPEQI